MQRDIYVNQLKIDCILHLCRKYLDFRTDTNKNYSSYIFNSEFLINCQHFLFLNIFYKKIQFESIKSNAVQFNTFDSSAFLKSANFLFKPGIFMILSLSGSIIKSHLVNSTGISMKCILLRCFTSCIIFEECNVI